MVTGAELSGKSAFVTGASRGIGRAIAVGFAAAGADVALVARTEDALNEVAAEIETHGRKALVLPSDVTDRDAVYAAVARTAEAFGGIDVVVNNAGGTRFAVPFTEMRFSGWEKVMRLNVDAAVHVCGAVGPHLLERGSGAVINVASVAGLVGSPGVAPYGASKSALISLTKTLAVEWAPHGVRVNALCPGWVATELNRNLWGDEGASAMLMSRVPMDRWARVEEMIAPAVFLASDASSYMTGHVLVIDGGQSAT
ncbi:MAG: glucose 1-dehydrogenase [Streptosporangiales bacterium]|nr:glucose 1-dehydrogenase [Streptosporangiales bacterium]